MFIVDYPPSYPETSSSDLPAYIRPPTPHHSSPLTSTDTPITQIKIWMQDCGMETWVDEVGNVHGRIRARRDGTQTVLLGSHYDTVLDGGA